MSDKVGLVDILRSYIKGYHIKWLDGVCTYKGYEILEMGEDENAGLVWVRKTMPDMRDCDLNPADPDFFEKLDIALVNALRCVNEVEATKEALDAFREHLGY